MTNPTYIPEALYEHGIVDLIPVIPPGARLAPSSTIPQSHVGKIPGRQLASGLWAGFDWRHFSPTRDDVRGYNASSANVGLRADYFPALDIDCLDENLSAIIETEALGILGPAPVRVGRAPKRLLMYRLEPDTEKISRMRLIFEKDGVQHLVEFLGAGQQYVVHGIHPQTMQPYAWSRDMAALGVVDLTPVSRTKVNQFFDSLAHTLELAGCSRVDREGDGRPRTPGSVEAQAGLAAPSLEVLKDAVRRIPNTNALYPDRADYIKMGFAIRAAWQADSDEAYAIFAEWCGKREGAANWRGGVEPENVLSDWRRFRAPYSVGWNWIAETARGFGFDAASLDFEIVADEQPGGRPDDAVRPAFLSDQWLAEQVVAAQRGRIRYVPQKRQYLVWDMGKWQPDAELLAEDVIKQELRAVADRIAKHGSTDKEKNAAAKMAQKICSAASVGNVASLLKSDRAIAVGVQALDHDPWVLNTPGGLVDLKTATIRPPDPDALCSRSTSVTPDFTGGCPEWLRFLQEASGEDADMVAYIQRLAGYALTGSTREQHLTFFFGPGGNGKSVLLNVLMGVLGDYGTVASMDTFTASHSDKHTTEIAMLSGARLVAASETQAGKRWDEAKVKALTGGEPVTARFMRQDNFTFLPKFKLIFVGNHKPELRDVDDAMRRRIHMVPFVVSPKVVDKELAMKLRDEFPAILAWMLQGCLDWQQVGLNPPPAVKAMTEEYFSDEDTVGRFIKECCEVGEDYTVLTRDLYQAWREWTNGNGEYLGTMKRLAGNLRAKRFERWQHTTSRQMGFRGIRLKPQDGLEPIT